MCERKKNQLNEFHVGEEKNDRKFDMGFDEPESFVSNQQFFIFKCDISGNLLYLSNSLERLIPESGRESRFPFGSFLDERQKEKFVKTIERCIEFSELPKFVNVTYAVSNSERATMYWEVQRIRNKETGSDEVLGVGTDINRHAGSTNLNGPLVKAMLDQTAQINSFNYIISHHIRRHSVNISGLLELISLSHDNLSETAEYIEYLNFSAIKLDKMIKDLCVCINSKLPNSRPLEVKNLWLCLRRVLKLLNPSI